MPCHDCPEDTEKKGDVPCADCGTYNNPVWHTDSEIWNAVMDRTDERYIILCPYCFAQRAKDVWGTMWKMVPTCHDCPATEDIDPFTKRCPKHKRELYERAAQKANEDQRRVMEDYKGKE